jgi:hypothetical protein
MPYSGRHCLALWQLALMLGEIIMG